MPKLFIIALVCCLAMQVGQAQSLEQRLSQSRPSCRDVMMNAMEELPAMYAAKKLDSAIVVIDFIKKHCGESTEGKELAVLLAIEQNRFAVKEFYDSSSVSLLQLHAVRNQYRNRYYYDSAQVKYNQLSQQWANDLLQRTGLDAESRLICEVLANKQTDPEKIIERNKEVYPVLYDLVEKNNNRSFNEGRMLAGLSAGAWIPTNNLSALGTHPSIGILFGMRNKHNEVTVNLFARFVSAPNDYQVRRRDSVYNTNYYSGVYAGLNYTRYLWQNRRTAFGLSAGAGYDAINVFKPDNDNDEREERIKPREIATLNVNTGFQFNYYYKAFRYVGLTARYNMVNYKNAGGTNLRGDAITLSLIWGSESGRNRWWY